MLKKLIAILLILIGIVAVAGGVWGLSMQNDSDINPEIAGAALKFLQGADDVMGKIDGTVSEWSNGSFTLTSVLNSLTGDTVDLTSDSSVTAANRAIRSITSSEKGERGLPTSHSRAAPAINSTAAI